MRLRPLPAGHCGSVERGFHATVKVRRTKLRASGGPLNAAEHTRSFST
jgi:hypothetical protein